MRKNRQQEHKVKLPDLGGKAKQSETTPDLQVSLLLNSMSTSRISGSKPTTRGHLSPAAGGHSSPTANSPQNKTRAGVRLAKLPSAKISSKNQQAHQRVNNRAPNSGKKEALSKKKPVLPDIKSKEALFDDILEGDLSRLPALPSSTVRIFLSSTFSDMRAERNALIKETYPQLKEYCRQLGLDFQVVDMRWGVTDDATNDHSTETLCLTELANCQRLSLGPNFVSFLGQRYGYRPIPPVIPTAEFTVLVAELEKEDEEGERGLLQEWYICDENSVPPVYQLQPIRTKFPHFGDHSSEDLHQEAKTAWWEMFERLQSTLRMAAMRAKEKGTFTEEQKHEYFLSVTECEIQSGILNVGAKAENHTMCYRRALQGLDNNAALDKLAKRYIETIQQEEDKVIIDEETAGFRNDLAYRKVPSHIAENYLREFTVEWRSDGVQPSMHREHADYIDKFCSTFLSDTKDQIEKASKENEEMIRRSEYYSEPEEVLHNCHFCLKKCETFCGQGDTLKRVRAFCSKPQGKPLVIYAESGVGKTSLMAMVFLKVHEWFGSECFRMIKFLGTSPESSDIYNVLFGICGQLADTEDVIMEPMGYENMKNLTAFFPRFIRNISRLNKQKIFILLDSIDQLSDEDRPFLMKWVPTILPSNVYLILSMLPREKGCLANLQKLLPDDKCYIELLKLPQTTGVEITEKYLRRKGRTITAEQKDLLMSAFSRSSSPLFLKLLLDTAATWRSNTPLDTINLPSSVREAITQLFESLEKKYGECLVRYALGYITVSQGGLSEIELEDALSCNDEVLNAVYQYHNPPVEGIVRIPPLLWARIRYDTQEYLVERQSGGKTTIFWYHRQFIEAARDRYATAAMAVNLHRGLMEIFLNEEGIKKDIVLSKRNLTIRDADRQVTVQPLVSGNKRKLEALLHHLVNTKDTALLKKHAVCSLRFLALQPRQCLSAIITALEMEAQDKCSEEGSRGDVNDENEEKEEVTFAQRFSQGDLVVNDGEDAELVRLGVFLSRLQERDSSKSRLTCTSIANRLLLELYVDAEQEPNLASLMQEAREMVCKNEVYLLPLYPSSAFCDPRDPLPAATKESILDQSCCGVLMTYCLVNSNGSILTVAANEGANIALWDVSSGKLLKQLEINLPTAKILTLLDDSLFAGIHEESRQLCVYDMDGQEVLTGVSAKALSITADNKREHLYVLTKDDKSAPLECHLFSCLEKRVIKTTKIGKIPDFTSVDITLSREEKFVILKIISGKSCMKDVSKEIKEGLGRDVASLEDQILGVSMLGNLQGKKVLGSNTKPKKKVTKKKAVPGATEFDGKMQLASFDVKKFSGDLRFCNRPLMTAPMLCHDCLPLPNHDMLLARDRITILWDVEGGACDQRMSKMARVPMMYRPEWLEKAEGKEHGGAAFGMITCMAMPRNNPDFVAVGSEDGWMLIYETLSGLAVKRRKPPTKHKKPVHAVAMSDDGKWTVSCSQDGTIILWDTSEARDVYTIKSSGYRDAPQFTQDGNYLVTMTTGWSQIGIYRLAENRALHFNTY